MQRKGRGCTIKLVIPGVIRRPEITACIVGATKTSQLEDNVKASGLKLPADVIARIDEIMK